jgi:hypothetical protein
VLLANDMNREISSALKFVPRDVELGRGGSEIRWMAGRRIRPVTCGWATLNAEDEDVSHCAALLRVEGKRKQAQA